MKSGQKMVGKVVNKTSEKGVQTLSDNEVKKVGEEKGSKKFMKMVEEWVEKWSKI